MHYYRKVKRGLLSTSVCPLCIVWLTFLGTRPPFLPPQIGQLLGLDVEEIKFRQSAIGVTTRKALETASARIVSRMIVKQVFKN